MTRLGSKRLYLVIAVIGVVVGAAAAYMTVVGGAILGWRLGPPPKLSESAAEVTLAVDVLLPDESGGGAHSFRGSGMVDYPTGRARMRYDFTGLTNAAGFLGHLERFGVAFGEGGAFVEVYPQDPAWLLFDASELAALRVGRLREVALSSPLLIPLLLPDTEDAREGERAATYDVEVASLSADNGAQSQALELLEQLDIKTVEVNTSYEDGLPSTVGYQVAFPVTEGARSEVVVTISTGLVLTGGTIALPDKDEYRVWAEFYD